MNAASKSCESSILISAGGTGGHIFPGIALGQALAHLAPDVPIHYVCGNRPLELRLYESESIQPIILPSSAVSGGFIRKLSSLGLLGMNTVRAMGIIRQHSCRVVVGFGGYTSGPTMAAAVLLRRRTVLHEANAVPGRANRLLAPWVSAVTGHFPSSVDSLGGRNKSVVGMPLRRRGTPPSRTEAMAALGLDPARRTILITGGSQGARGLNQKVLASLRQLDVMPNSDIQVLWATGHNHLSEVEGELQRNPMQWIRVHAVPFIDRMDYALVAADGAVARAGASTIAELLSAGVFPWLIPFPYAVHNHQVLNARVVVDQQAGWMTEERDLTPEVMTDHLRKMMDRVRSLPPGARKAPPANLDSTHAAERLAKLVLGQLDRKAPVPSISSA